MKPPIQVGGLTDRQRIFATEYAKDLNASRAARTAGYKHAGAIGSRLLDPAKYPLVANLVQEELERRKQECRIEGKRVVEELARVAFFNPKDLFDTEGNLRDIHELPDSVAVCIKKFRTSYRVGMGTDRQPVKVKITEVEIWDKMSALKQLAQHLGLLKGDTINNTVQVIDWNGMAQPPQLVGGPTIDPVEQRIVQALANAPPPLPEGAPLPQGEVYKSGFPDGVSQGEVVDHKPGPNGSPPK